MQNVYCRLKDTAATGINDMPHHLNGRIGRRSASFLLPLLSFGKQNRALINGIMVAEI